MIRIFYIVLLTGLLMLIGPFGTNKKANAGDLPLASSESIGISIMGTIVAKTSGRNVVLVKEIDSGKVQAYRAGNAIMEKHRIIEISNKYIIVMKDNVKMKVYQDKFAASATASNKPSRPKFADNFSEEGFERKGGKVKMTGAYRDKLVKQDMAKIMMQATAQPFMKDGAIRGFQLSQIDAGSVFEKGGFRDYDVITSINGIDLDSVSGAIKLLNNLKSADAIDIVIERDGVEQEMALSID